LLQLLLELQHLRTDLVALLVASFSIHNTFSIVAAQRSRESALLRAIGATRAQVLGSVVLEAFVVGVLATVIGIGAVVLGLGAVRWQRGEEVHVLRVALLLAGLAALASRAALIVVIRQLAARHAAVIREA
jgi:putative ABC transport system permease protein